MSGLRSDCREVALLELRMSGAGDRIEVLERVVGRRPNGLVAERIAQLVGEQDRINARLHRILSRYEVDYSGRGFFTVSDGVETVRFDAPEVSS